MFALAGAPGAWEAPTACPEWQVRDVVGHLIDVTESYFVGFDAARGGPAAAGGAGRTGVMQHRLDEGAKAHRELGQSAALARLTRRLRQDDGASCDGARARTSGAG